MLIIIGKVLWHSPEANSQELLKISIFGMYLTSDLRLLPHRPEGYVWVNDSFGVITAWVIRYEKRFTLFSS